MTTPLLPGAEPFSHSGGAHGVLVLHGFTGSPASMRPLAEALAAAGYSVELPRLPGHGTSVADMKTTGWSDWTAAALAAYDDLAARSESVAVVGLSMGGGLTAHVAQHREVAACVYINPLVKPVDAELYRGLEELLAAGVEEFESIGEDIKKEGVSEAAYPATPLVCAKSLFDGVVELHENLSRISAPGLLLQSREDHVVTADNGDALLERVSGPLERIWLEDSYHVATLDNDRPLVESATVSFLARTLA
ncbi:MAG TPA: alpha/beta fold hydrolase [Acidimicrobiales bacterium]|nr:alpha/beta fold hydrolase [Acidimicrobiales bacterium]